MTLTHLLTHPEVYLPISLSIVVLPVHMIRVPKLTCPPPANPLVAPPVLGGHSSRVTHWLDSSQLCVPQATSELPRHSTATRPLSHPVTHPPCTHPPSHPPTSSEPPGWACNTTRCLKATRWQGRRSRHTTLAHQRTHAHTHIPTHPPTSSEPPGCASSMSRCLKATRWQVSSQSAASCLRPLSESARAGSN